MSELISDSNLRHQYIRNTFPHPLLWPACELLGHDQSIKHRSLLSQSGHNNYKSTSLCKTCIRANSFWNIHIYIDFLLSIYLISPQNNIYTQLLHHHFHIIISSSVTYSKSYKGFYSTHMRENNNRSTTWNLSTVNRVGWVFNNIMATWVEMTRIILVNAVDEQFRHCILIHFQWGSGKGLREKKRWLRNVSSLPDSPLPCPNIVQ